MYGGEGVSILKSSDTSSLWIKWSLFNGACQIKTWRWWKPRKCKMFSSIMQISFTFVKTGGKIRKKHCCIWKANNQTALISLSFIYLVLRTKVFSSKKCCVTLSFFILYHLIKQDCIRAHQTKYVLCDLSRHPMGKKAQRSPWPFRAPLPCRCKSLTPRQ